MGIFIVAGATPLGLIVMYPRSKVAQSGNLGLWVVTALRYKQLPTNTDY